MSASNIGRSPTQSPATLITGPTSSNPTTPLEPPPRQTLPQHRSLRQRIGTVMRSAEDMAGRVSLPDVVAQSSLAKTSASTIKDAVMPTLSTVGSVIKTGIKAVKQFSQTPVSSQPLQNALRAELDPAKFTPEQRDQASANQLNAHREAVAYGQGSSQWLDRVMPFATSVLRVGLAGTSMAFGVGRNSGLAAGDAAARAEQGRPQSGAVFDNGAAAPSAAPSGPPSVKSMVVSTIAQLFGGSAAGATGNLLGQTVVAPVINLMPRQFAPINDKAVVPDQIVNDMNALMPGAGTKLREAVKAQQAEITNISSETNVTLGQVAFDAVTAARAAALGTTPLGVAGQVGFGLSVSATAGGVIGAVMGVRQSVATIKVPDAEKLSALVAAGRTDGAQALEQLMKSPNDTHEVPLFFAKHMNAAAPSTSTPAGAASDLEAGTPTTPAPGPAPRRAPAGGGGAQRVGGPPPPGRGGAPPPPPPGAGAAAGQRPGAGRRRHECGGRPAEGRGERLRGRAVDGPPAQRPGSPGAQQGKPGRTYADECWREPVEPLEGDGQVDDPARRDLDRDRCRRAAAGGKRPAGGDGHRRGHRHPHGHQTLVRRVGQGHSRP